MGERFVYVRQLKLNLQFIIASSALSEFGRCAALRIISIGLERRLPSALPLPRALILQNDSRFLPVSSDELL